MTPRSTTSETSFVHLLAVLWEELEDLLDLHYGGGDATAVEHLRLKLEAVRRQLANLVAQAEREGPQQETVARQSARLRLFGQDLLQLLDLDARDDAFELACGTTMVLAQNRIMDEAQRLALAR